jgi:thymidylate kinase
MVYITGADGTGKTSQARLLLNHLRRYGVHCRAVWLRFPFLFSLPLLVYARWRGFSWHEVVDGIDHGYWDFRLSWTMRVMFPWVLWLDAALAAIRTVYVPMLMGETIICERFVLDMLVDLMVATGDYRLHRRLPGNLFLGLLPNRARPVVLDLDPGTIRRRRDDLRTDRELENRLQGFRRLSSDLSLPVLSSRIPMGDLNRRIQELMGIVGDAGEEDRRLRQVQV